MTRDELLVIAAAAAAFVIINIIMWSIIAKKERKAKGIAASQDAIAENTVSSVPSSTPRTGSSEDIPAAFRAGGGLSYIYFMI